MSEGRRTTQDAGLPERDDDVPRCGPESQYESGIPARTSVDTPPMDACGIGGSDPVASGGCSTGRFDS